MKKLIIILSLISVNAFSQSIKPVVTRKIERPISLMIQPQNGFKINNNIYFGSAGSKLTSPGLRLITITGTRKKKS